MLFSGRRRVDEDVERIRRASLPPQKLEALEKEERQAREAMKGLSLKSLVAIILALLSLILPYFLVFAALFAGLWFIIRFML